MGELLPGFEVNAVLGPFVAIAVSMVAITVVVLGLVLALERRPPLFTQMLLAVAVVGGGNLLLLALVFAFVNPNGTDAWTWVLMAFNFMMAVPVGLWFVALVVYHDRRVAPGDWFWPLALAGATAASEVLMGILFAVGEANGTLGLLPSVGAGLSSVWYFWSMAAVMAGLLSWARLSPTERTVAWGLLGAALLAPWVGAYPEVGGLALGGVMALVLGVVLRLLLAQRVGPREAPLLLVLSVAFLAMTLSGLGLVATGGSDAGRVAFGAVMGVVMTGEIAFLVRSCYGSAEPSEAPTTPVEAAVPSGSSRA